MGNTKISAPWYTFVRELTEMFKEDKDITVKYDDTNQVLTLSITKYEKAEALKRILPQSKIFGNVKLAINIEYSSDISSMQDVIKHAFENNPAFKYMFTVQTDTNPITYVIFAKEVVQYWNDDLHDPHGITSTLYENIARDIFDEKNGLVFSTDSDVNKKSNFGSKTQPTNEEIAMWENYNGKGSYSDGSTLSESETKPISGKFVANEDKEKVLKSLFNYKKKKDEFSF